MVNQEVIDYIKLGLSKGATKDVIISNLKSAGWFQSDMDEAFALIERGDPATAQPILKTGKNKKIAVFVTIFTIFSLGVAAFFFVKTYTNKQPLSELSVQDDLVSQPLVSVQETEKVVEPPTMPAVENKTANTVDDFGNWQTYTYHTRGFSVKFPAAPEITILSKGKSPVDIMETIEVTVGKYKYGVDYIDVQPAFYKSTDTIAQKEEKGILFYFTIVALSNYASGLKLDIDNSEAKPLDGHLTRSFTMTGPGVTFVGNVTAIDGKVYAYSTECNGGDCTNVPLREEFLKSFSLKK